MARLGRSLVCGPLADRRGLRRLDVWDLGLALFVGGHLIAGLVALMGFADDRATVNMLWEWMSLAVCLWILRDIVVEADGWRRIALTIVVSAAVLSPVGLWQHLVTFPGLAAELAELDQLVASAEPRSNDDRQRLQELQESLGLSDLAPGEPAIQLLRNRIAYSQEPLGRFALANTLAGLLLVGLLLALSPVFGLDVNGLTRMQRLRWLVVAAAIGLCLWLTKSRTAWAGLFVGLITLGTLTRMPGRSTGEARWGWIAGLLILGLLPFVAAILGGLDREVISEAPKSLQYRLEYWVSTWQIIREHVWLGVGPGNFRQHYLRHKLPGSSEEILDPHNFLLDVWANGGILAVLGLSILLIVTFRGAITGQSTSCFWTRPPLSAPVREGCCSRSECWPCQSRPWWLSCVRNRLTSSS